MFGIIKSISENITNYHKQRLEQVKIVIFLHQNENRKFFQQKYMPFIMQYIYFIEILQKLFSALILFSSKHSFL